MFYGHDLARIHADRHEHLAEGAARTLAARLSRRSEILDIGCGGGALSIRLAALGHDVRGIDVSPALLSIAKTRLPEGRFDLADVLTAELGRVDAIAAIGEVVNYVLAKSGIGALKTLIARVRDALSDDGVFLFDSAGAGRHAESETVWSEDANSLVAMRARTSGASLTREIVTFLRTDGEWRRSRETHHMHLFDPFEVEDCLREAGFSVDRLPGYDGTPPIPALHCFLARFKASS